MPRHSTLVEERDLIINFSALMLRALVAERDKKEAWPDIQVEVLIEGLVHNHEQLITAFIENSSSDVRKRCVNIANFAAMIADRYKE